MAAASEEIFIPTHVVNYQGELVGEILWELSCKALIDGQCPMIVGGYIVKGTIESCKNRARAVRRDDGAFERVAPQPIGFVHRPAALPPPQLSQPPTVPTGDLGTVASSICLAIQGTPSPASNVEHCLLPGLEAQAAVDASELPVQEEIQLFHGVLQSQQPLVLLQQQQFDEDTAAQKLASIHDGKRPLPPTIAQPHDNSTTQALFDNIYKGNIIDPIQGCKGFVGECIWLRQFECKSARVGNGGSDDRKMAEATSSSWSYY